MRDDMRYTVIHDDGDAGEGVGGVVVGTIEFRHFDPNTHCIDLRGMRVIMAGKSRLSKAECASLYGTMAAYAQIMFSMLFDGNDEEFAYFARMFGNSCAEALRANGCPENVIKQVTGGVPNDQ